MIRRKTPVISVETGIEFFSRLFSNGYWIPGFIGMTPSKSTDTFTVAISEPTSPAAYRLPSAGAAMWSAPMTTTASSSLLPI
jgi:hypothetical protein